jgi:uncharacterized protein (DUF433 family)
MNRKIDRDPYRGRDPREIPAYDTSAAARYLRIPENTIRNWVFGRAYRIGSGQPRRAQPLIDVAGARFLSFINLVELHVLGALRREHNVDMRSIRRAIEYLQAQLSSAHPLVDEEMATDGISIFVKKYGRMINASRDGQLAMEQLFHARLKRIERDAHGAAIRLFPFTRRLPEDLAKGAVMPDAPRIIAIDPAVAFGRPVIAGSRVPTVEVYERFRAGESPDEIAEDFGRQLDEIHEAIRCEAA